MLLVSFFSKQLINTFSIITTFILLFCTFSAIADDKLLLFVTSENQSQDQVNGVGISGLLKNKENNFGVEILTSIANAEVIDTTGINQKYIAWEVGAKFGYFSKVFIYAELGFDFGEFALQSRGEDSECNDQNENNELDFTDFITNKVDDDANDIDGYIGVGAGYDFGHFQLEAFTRYRSIDGEYWKADNQHFVGIRASVSFF